MLLADSDVPTWAFPAGERCRRGSGAVPAGHARQPCYEALVHVDAIVEGSCAEIFQQQQPSWSAADVQWALPVPADGQAWQPCEEALVHVDAIVEGSGAEMFSAAAAKLVSCRRQVGFATEF